MTGPSAFLNARPEGNDCDGVPCLADAVTLDVRGAGCTPQIAPGPGGIWSPDKGLDLNQPIGGATWWGAPDSSTISW